MPFGKDLAPGMLFRSRAHAEATARIAWLVAERAIGVVTGEVGAGKTVAARAAVAGFEPSRHTVIYLPNPAIGARGLYQAIVSALGGVPKFLKASLIPQAVEMIATEEVERGKRVVVVVDEAPPSSSRRSGCSPTPRWTRARRSPACCSAKTVGYVKHHLGLAGRSDPLFSDDALALIHQIGRGLPRAVNNLAVQSLVAAFAEGKGMVDESSARASVTEVNAD
jgi:type II secretory pathway predicted ATPase ExeA